MILTIQIFVRHVMSKTALNVLITMKIHVKPVMINSA